LLKNQDPCRQKAWIEERTGAAKATVQNKKKKAIYEEMRIGVVLYFLVGCYEWVRPDETAG
jgi:hypothetical protein